MTDRVNSNRREPFANPDIKVGKVENPGPSNSTKDIGGGPINNDSYNWKDIQNSQNRRARRD